jgi:hypothetical protein
MSKLYAPLIDALAEQSISTYFQDEDQLVVCTQSGPAFPFAGNSFWVSNRGGQWYLCTWGPVCYEVPATADCAALCAEFVRRGTCAKTFVSADLVHKYGLRQMDDNEYDQVLSCVRGPRWVQ